MKKLLLLLFCLPFWLMAQAQQNNKGELYFLSNVHEETLVWEHNTSSGYGYWNQIHDDGHAEFSEYDVATSTLTSQILDTVLLEELNETISCFDPTTNMLYSVNNPYDEEGDTLYMGALDVTTGNLTLVPLGANDGYFNWDPGSPGDTIVDIYNQPTTMECWNNKIYFLSEYTEETLVWEHDTSFGYGYWNQIHYDAYVEFSEYDVATSTLTSQMLDTALLEELNETISCFDPTTNMLYSVNNPYDEEGDTLYMGALDVTTGNLTLVPLGANDGYFNWDPGSPGDTIVDIYNQPTTMECWNNKIYFLSDVYEQTLVWVEDSFGYGWWHQIHDDGHVEFSEYDVATSTLTSQTLDTALVYHLEQTISCFDPTTNMLYAVADEEEGADSLYIGALDVTTGNLTLVPIVANHDDYWNWSGSLGDTIDNVYNSPMVIEAGYSLPGDSMINITACDSYSWNGNIYDSSGIFIYTTENTIFLDSTVTLNLTITNSTSNTTTATACGAYTWPVDGTTYTASGTYTNVSTNAAGCDHTETLELTINSVIASISQSGDSLFAVTTPIGLTANWYNIQTEDATTRIWLMEEGVTTFMPRFDCSYFIVVSNNGCIDTSEVYSYGANAARIGSFITSPNPTTGFVNVKFDNPKSQFVMFELISNNGSKLNEFITVENNLNIDLSNYPSGSYYLYFNSEDALQGCRLEDVQKVSTKIILNK